MIEHLEWKLPLGFLIGCLFTYWFLYRPIMESNRKYQEGLETRIKELIRRS